MWPKDPATLPPGRVRHSLSFPLLDKDWWDLKRWIRSRTAWQEENLGDTGRSLGSIEEMAVQTPEALGSLRGTKERGTGLWDVSDHPVCAYSGKDWVEFGTIGGHDSPLRK